MARTTLLPLGALLLAGESQVWGASLRQAAGKMQEPLVNGEDMATFGKKNRDALHMDNLTNITDRWSFWSKPPGSKKVLVSVVGTFKSFGQFWENLYYNFIQPQQKAGWEVFFIHNLPYTSPNCSASKTTMQTHKAEWCKALRQRWKGGVTMGASRSAGHVAGVADNHFFNFDSQDVCRQKEGEEAPGAHSTTDYLGGDWRSVGCGGMMHFASRGTQVMDRFRNKRGWDKVVILRGDNSFSVRHRPKDLTAPILLEKACGRRDGGVKIIGPANTQDMFGADFDQAWILCEGSRAGPFRRALASMGLECDANCTAETAPPCPAGTDLCKEGERLPCSHQLCETASVLAKANTTLGMVDPELGYMLTSHRQPVVFQANGRRKNLFYLMRSDSMKPLASGVEPTDEISTPVIVD